MTKAWTPGYSGVPKGLGRRVLRRDPLCLECHERASTVPDHLVPRAEGGADTLENLRGLCEPCHDVKTKAESLRGRQRRAASRRLPGEAHPGVQVAPNA